MTKLSWQFEQSTLLLNGELSEATLLPLWQQRQSISASVTSINLAGLTRVDTAGLALLINFHQTAEKPIQFIGVGNQINQLIDLYNLRDLIT